MWKGLSNSESSQALGWVPWKAVINLSLGIFKRRQDKEIKTVFEHCGTLEHSWDTSFSEYLY